MTYISAADAAKTIRATLKKVYGITSRQVSVRSDSFSGGSSIDITINDPTIDAKEVKNIANGHERVRRCEYSGEILSGGNRYVSVSYGEKAVAAEFENRKDYYLAIAAEFVGFEKDSGREFDGLLVMKGSYPWDASVALKDPSSTYGGYFSGTRFNVPTNGDVVAIAKAIASAALYHKGVH